MIFVCLGFNDPLNIFALACRRHDYRWRASNFLPMLGSSEGSLACHAYCDTGLLFIMHGNFLGPMTLTSVAERLAVNMSLPVFTNNQPSACETNALTD